MLYPRNFCSSIPLLEAQKATPSRLRYTYFLKSKFFHDRSCPCVIFRPCCSSVRSKKKSTSLAALESGYRLSIADAASAAISESTHQRFHSICYQFDRRESSATVPTSAGDPHPALAGRQVQLSVNGGTAPRRAVLAQAQGWRQAPRRTLQISAVRVVCVSATIVEQAPKSNQCHH